MSDEILNANIRYTHLGFEDHGILTFFINFDYGGGRQGCGNWGLCGVDCEVIQDVLKAVGATSWEALPKTPVRVKRENQRIVGFGHYLEDKWFILMERMDKHRIEKNKES